jgi:hypothetical protein
MTRARLVSMSRMKAAGIQVIYSLFIRGESIAPSGLGASLLPNDYRDPVTFKYLLCGGNSILLEGC